MNGDVKSATDLAMNFIRNSPAPYESAVGIYQASGTATIMNVTEGLRRIQVQNAISSVGSEERENEALTVAGGGDHRQCFFCKENGHIRRDCPKYKALECQALREQ